MDNHANAARHEAANGTYPAQLFGHVPGTHPKTESQTKLSPTGYHAQSTTQSCHPRDLWLWNLAPELPSRSSPAQATDTHARITRTDVPDKRRGRAAKSELASNARGGQRPRPGPAKPGVGVGVGVGVAGGPAEPPACVLALD